MSIFSAPDFDDHEAVHVIHDGPSGLKAIIALHSTHLGPGFGGCRFWTYENEQAAMDDALRLSRGMSYKNALAGLAYGGGKAVILGGKDLRKTPELFEAFGRAVEQLNGSYVTAEDVGVSVEDMLSVAKTTKHVSGIPRTKGAFQGGDPSPRTARGVFEGLRAAVKFGLDSDLEGLTVAVQGLGSVGYNLASLLHAAGAHLIVADLSDDAVQKVCDTYGAERAAPDEILHAKADVLAPCALGGVLNEKTIPALNVKVVAGAANNQLATEQDGARLMEHGIVYAPDYVINAGGIISVAAEYDGTANAQEVDARVADIGPRTYAILEEASHLNRPADVVADERARVLIGRAEPNAIAAE